MMFSTPLQSRGVRTSYWLVSLTMLSGSALAGVATKMEAQQSALLGCLFERDRCRLRVGGTPRACNIFNVILPKPIAAGVLG